MIKSRTKKVLVIWRVDLKFIMSNSYFMDEMNGNVFHTKTIGFQ